MCGLLRIDEETEKRGMDIKLCTIYYFFFLNSWMLCFCLWIIAICRKW